LDTGPFILTVSNEGGAEKIRRIVERHEAQEIEVFVHPNCLVEAYKVISELQNEKSVDSSVDPAEIIRSTYATLSVLQNEMSTIQLGRLRHKYRNKPWGDLSSASLALALSSGSGKNVPVVILDHEAHFKDIDGVDTLRVSQL
jgi:hypothetical protein